MTLNLQVTGNNQRQNFLTQATMLVAKEDFLRVYEAGRPLDKENFLIVHVARRLVDMEESLTDTAGRHAEASLPASVEPIQ